MKCWVDASPTKACVVFEGVPEPVVKEVTSKYTNNEAEYRAVLLALYLARIHRLPLTEICSDSQLVVNQLNGTCKVNKVELKELRKEVLAKTNGRVKFSWVPREANPAGKVLG